MSRPDPTLYLLCGKIASGKSTLAGKLADQENTVLISEDAWIHPLFGDQMSTGADFVRCSGKLQAVMKPHVAALLNMGVSVVLDFAANTVAQRNWMRSILDISTAAHELHVLDVPDALCLERLHARNAEGEHPFAATDDQFRAFSKHFQLPTEDEGFNIIRH
jgi:predicted kinase